MTSTVGRLEELTDQIFSLGWMIVKTALGEANPN